MKLSYQIWVGYQKSLKQTFKTGFWVQNHLLNSCSTVNSQRLLCSQKLSGIQKDLLNTNQIRNLYTNHDWSCKDLKFKYIILYNTLFRYIWLKSFKSWFILEMNDLLGFSIKFIYPSVSFKKLHGRRVCYSKRCK